MRLIRAATGNRYPLVVVPVLLGALFAPCAATAAAVFWDIASPICGGRPVADNSALRQHLIGGAGGMSPGVAKALREGHLGEAALSAASECLAPASDCAGDKLTLARLYMSALPLADDPLVAPSGFDISVDKRIAPPAIERGVDFLDGKWDWLVVRCPVDNANESTAVATDRQ